MPGSRSPDYIVYLSNSSVKLTIICEGDPQLPSEYPTMPHQMTSFLSPKSHFDSYVRWVLYDACFLFLMWRVSVSHTRPEVASYITQSTCMVQPHHSVGLLSVLSGLRLRIYPSQLTTSSVEPVTWRVTLSILGCASAPQPPPAIGPILTKDLAPFIRPSVTERLSAWDQSKACARYDHGVHTPFCLPYLFESTSI